MSTCAVGVSALFVLGATLNELSSIAPRLAELVERSEREPAALADELAAFSVQTIMQPLTPLPECQGSCQGCGMCCQNGVQMPTSQCFDDPTAKFCCPAGCQTPTCAARPPPAQPASPSRVLSKRVPSGGLPIVVAHGMGDSCFNSGMKSITKEAGTHMGVYSTCIPTGDDRIRDTINGFLLNMDKSVDVFAAAVKADPKLAGGFNAIGLSQGNQLIRGYIQKYNNPPVNAYLSICGINAGVAAFPQCNPDTPVIGNVCAALTEVLGDLAYYPVVQEHLFQANYFRDPTHVNNDTKYQLNAQLAQWNGEGVRNMTADKANFGKTPKLVWIRGTEDTVVWPNQGEQWGQLSADYPANKSVVPMHQATWYTSDAFGLKTADLAGRNYFEQFRGQHIRFTTEELYGWLDKYFV